MTDTGFEAFRAENVAVRGRALLLLVSKYRMMEVPVV